VNKIVNIKLSSSAKTTYSLSLEIEPKWIQYWTTDQSSQSSADLYQAVSNQLINQAYIDMPQYLLDCDDTTITPTMIRHTHFESLLTLNFYLESLLIMVYQR